MNVRESVGECANGFTHIDFTYCTLSTNSLVKSCDKVDERYDNDNDFFAIFLFLLSIHVAR